MKQGYYKKDSSMTETEKPKTMKLYLYFKCNNCKSTWHTAITVPYSDIQSNGFNQTEYDYCDDCKEGYL